MIPKLKKKPDPQAREAPRAPKPKTNLLVIPVEKDKKEINYRKNWPNLLSKNRTLRQFVYEKDEKNHYDCFENLPVFDIDDKHKMKHYTFSHRRKVLQTLNGKLIDPTKIKNEIDLLRYTTFAGIGHTENVKGPYDKMLFKLSEHFDAIYYGRPTLKNYCFTRPLRNIHNGLLHKSSCQRKQVTHGQLITISFMPFDFEMVEKITKAKQGGSWVTEFGKSEDELNKDGWITDIGVYDPTLPKWYAHWFKGTNKMPDRIVGNERIIPIYHTVCDKVDVFEHMEKKLFLQDIVRTLHGIPKGVVDYTGGPFISTITNKNDYNGRVDLLSNDENFNFDRWMYRMNTNLAHMKIMGTPRDHINVQFGGDMVVQLLMNKTS